MFKKIPFPATIILISLVLMTLQAFSVSFVGKVHALEGCVITTGSTSVNEPTYKTIDCPSSFTPTAGKCYVITSSSQGASSPVEKACSDVEKGLTVGQSPTNPPSGTTGEKTVVTKSDVEEACAGKSGIRYSVTINGNKYDCYNKCQLAEKEGDTGCEDIANNPIVKYLNYIINIAAGGVGLVIVAMVTWGGIQYTTSRGNPQATAAAISRIRNALIALLLYIFGYAILSWLIPGAPL